MSQAACRISLPKTTPQPAPSPGYYPEADGTHAARLSLRMVPELFVSGGIKNSEKLLFKNNDSLLHIVFLSPPLKRELALLSAMEKSMHQACTNHKENDTVLLAETLRSSTDWGKAEEDGLIFDPLHKR